MLGPSIMRFAWFAVPSALGFSAAASLLALAACSASNDDRVDEPGTAESAVVTDAGPARDAGDAGDGGRPAVASPAAPRDETRAVTTREEVWLFSGDGTTKLGCLTCGRYASESVWNPYGTYGSRYSSTSIWNPYGTYGSPYSSTSPWNAFASNPPVLYTLDKRAYYGALTKAWSSGRSSLYDATRLVEGGPDQAR